LGDDKPIDTEFFQCTPILILLFDVRAILFFEITAEEGMIRYDNEGI
jgi:hypothetical protein